MDDLAESVIKQLSVTDGKGPCAAVCSVAQEYNHRATFAVVLPVTKDGILSFNVDFVEDEPNMNNHWAPHASFNVATVQGVVESLFHWKSTIVPGKVDLLIEVANWNGYPTPGVGGRSPGMIRGFGAGHRKQHEKKEDVEATIRFLGSLRAPVSV